MPLLFACVSLMFVFLVCAVRRTVVMCVCVCVCVCRVPLMFDDRAEILDLCSCVFGVCSCVCMCVC